MLLVNPRRQVTSNAGFDDDANDLFQYSHSSEEEDTVSADGDREQALQDELHSLQSELQEDPSDITMVEGNLEMKLGTKSGQNSATSTIRSMRQRNTGLGLGLGGTLLLVDEFGKPYPKEYNNPLLDYFDDDQIETGKLSDPQNNDIKTGGGTITRNDIYQDIDSRSKTPSRSSSASTKNVRFKEPEVPTPATNMEIDITDDSEDDSFKPDEDTDTSIDESDKENATPRLNKSELEEVNSQIRRSLDDAAQIEDQITVDDSSSSPSDSESEYDETSSSAISSSSSSGGGSEFGNRTLARTFSEDSPTTSHTSSSTSSSSTSNSNNQLPDSARESRVSEAKENQALALATQVKSPDVDESIHAPTSVESRAPPGCGKLRTKMRNRRRKAYRRFIRQANVGMLPYNATPADSQSLNANNEPLQEENEDGSEHHGLQLNGDEHSSARAQSYQGRKEHFSNSQSIDDQNAHEALDTTPLRRAPENLAVQSTPAIRAAVYPSRSIESIKPSDAAVSPAGVRLDDGSLVANNSPILQAPTPSLKPRSKLDLESSRRLVFGALGHKAPKTKDDESNLRAKLLREVKIPKKSPMEDKSGNDLDQSAQNHTAWENKINLSAVECCHEDLVLSKPPFPFVQRWDPQQQSSYSKNSNNNQEKSKKRKRTRDVESFESVDPTESEQGPSQSNKTDADFSQGPRLHYRSDQPQSTMEDTNEENRKAANDQLMRETNETTSGTSCTVDELLSRLGCTPTMREDELKNLPSLKLDACVANALIAFKQLDMSQETNWQPRISRHRFALITDVLGDKTLVLKLAFSDRPQREKQYDERTGERLYSKFEMPGYDESEHEPDLLELNYVDLIEPLLVRPSKSEDEGLDLHSRENTDHVSHSVETGLISEESHQISSEEQPLQAINESSSESHRDADASAQARQEICDIIRDAGWRSSIQSNSTMDYNLGQNPLHDRKSADTSNRDSCVNPLLSPSFSRFGSSPPKGAPFEAEDLITYPAIQQTVSPGAAEEGIADTFPAEAIPESSSQTDMSAIRQIREDFENQFRTHEQNPPSGALHQPFNIHPGRSEPADNQKLGKVKAGDTLQDFPSPKMVPETQGVVVPSSQPDSLFSNPIFVSNDDDDCPPLEQIFSQVRSSFGTQASDPELVKSEPQSSKEAEEGPSIQDLPAWRSSQHNNISQSPQKPPEARQSNPKNSKPTPNQAGSGPAKLKAGGRKKMKLGEHEAASTPSQDYIGTQYVDLTLSSDPAVDMEMLDDACRKFTH